MAQFSYNDYLKDFTSKIYESQDLCKLLYYDVSNPLSQPDIADTTILHTDIDNQRLLFSPFTLTVEDTRITKLAVMLNEVDVDDNDYFRYMSITCILACHNDLWALDESSYQDSRPLLIWDELELVFNQQYINGLGKDKTSMGTLVYFNNSYTGYRIIYKGLSLPPRSNG